MYSFVYSAYDMRFCPGFLDGIAKTTWNHNVYSTLFDMQITQRVTSHCIMSVYKITYFVVYNNRK